MHLLNKEVCETSGLQRENMKTKVETENFLIIKKGDRYLNSMEFGSTFRALASLRIVTKVGFCFSSSSRAIVAYATPDNFAKSRWLRTAFSLNSFNFMASLLYHLSFIITIFIQVC